MEWLIQVGLVILILLGIVVLALLVPVVIRLRRTVVEAERTIVELRSQAVPTIQELPPTINRLQQVLDTTDTILKDTHTALMPAVQEAGTALSNDVIPSLREALTTVRHLIRVSQSVLEKVERIERVLSVVDTVTHPQKVVKVVKSVVSSPVARPSVWVEALRRGYAVLRGQQPTETPKPTDGSIDTESPPAGETPDEKRGGDDHVGQ